MAFGDDALAALRENNVQKLVDTFKKASKDAINARVQDGNYVGCTDLKDIKHEAGDTILHMALRNKKWPIRQACVETLAADSLVCNEQGRSPCGLQLETSGGRLGTSMICLGVLHFNIYGFDFGAIGYGGACVFVVVSLFDHLLAWRWWYFASMVRTARASGRGKEFGVGKQGRAKGKERQQKQS